MNKQVVDKWLSRYPKLEVFIGSGTVSLKAAREILCIDRYEMYDIYLELLEAQAIYGSGSNQFRATKELKAYLVERRTGGNTSE